MYDLTLLKKYNISLSWDEIYAGIAYDILTINSVSEFALDLAKKELLPNELNELLWELNNKEETLKLLKKLLNPKDIKINMLSIKKKLRYTILRELKDKESELSKDDILSQIALIYENFDYPSDMENFINYLPPKGNYNPNLHTLDENQTHLINEFHNFLINEEKDMI